MARIKVPQPDGQIGYFDGGHPVTYKVKNGEITVDDLHVVGVLAGVPGAELIEEPVAPAKSTKPEALAKGVIGGTAS